MILEGKIILFESFKRKMYVMIKRFFDILFSLIGMLFLVPVIILLKICYICSKDYEKIIYKQKRIGYKGKYFSIYKFRTMVPNADKVLEELLDTNPNLKLEFMENRKLSYDPRVTKLGKILRKTSIDELPQLINIFKGDMSFIGPRPIVDGEIDIYGCDKDKFLSVLPGLSGWWACNGRSDIGYDERKQLELYYVDNCSLKLDIKILFMTMLSVIKRNGAK